MNDMKGAALITMMKPAVAGQERCETCKFAKQAAQALECRRNPPVAFHVGNHPQAGPMFAASWPPTNPTAWCGEYKLGIFKP